MLDSINSVDFYNLLCETEFLKKRSRCIIFVIDVFAIDATLAEHEGCKAADCTACAQCLGMLTTLAK